MNEILMCGTDPVGQLYKDTKAEATSIAPIEVSPAKSSHSVGTHIMVDGVRYKVTSAISVGDTLTIGTNISAENIEDNLDATHIAYDSNTSVKEKIDDVDDDINIIKHKQTISVTVSGTKTYSQVLNELFALIDFSKMNIDSYMNFADVIFRVNRTVTTSSISFSNFEIDQNNQFRTRNMNLSTSSSKYKYTELNASGNVSVLDMSNTNAPNGATFTIYY